MVRGDCKASAATKLLFCTYGVLLRRLQCDPNMESVDYVILDEVCFLAMIQRFECMTNMYSFLLRCTREASRATSP
jgi:hypothetical protein